MDADERFEKMMLAMLSVMNHTEKAATLIMLRRLVNEDIPTKDEIMSIYPNADYEKAMEMLELYRKENQ